MESSGFSSRLAGLAGQARERAAAGEGRVLVSLSERVSSFDSLSALENLYRSSRADTQLADQTSEGCAYWAHPSEGFSIAGFGAAATFSPAGEGRFSNIDHDWRALLDGALIDDANASRAGVGPLLIGGFAFDPDGPGTDRWRGFPSAHMILPKVHVTSIRDESWITVSVIVEADSAIDLDALAELRGRFARSERITPLSSGDGQSSIRMADDLAEAQWCSIVSDAVDAIRGGDFQKVVLARSAHGETPGEINPFSVLRSLRSTHRHAFIFGYWRGSSAFVGASPERLVRLGNGHVSASSLAGTVRRGATREDDAALARELQTSAKDLAEHAVVRDMLREILTEVGENVESDDEPQLLTLSNVHHLHTEVEADLRAEYSLLDVVDRLHPTPAVGGTPRDAALDFIRDNERLDRGWYAAPVGWMDQSGGEFAVALRSGIVSGSEFTIFAGCGIVADSDPELEYAESVLKLQPMQSAIAASMANSIVDSRELALASEESE